VAAQGVVVDVTLQLPFRGRCVSAERELSEHRRRGERCGTGE
jgi:hypothetical protein